MSDAGSPAGSAAEAIEPNEPTFAEEEHLDNDDEPREGAGGATATELSDQESDALSEIDENQFEDYDPATADIEDRPVAVDEDVAKTLKAGRRKPVEGEAATRKPKEGRREKKRNRNAAEPEADDRDDAAGLDGDRPARKSRRAGGEGRQRAQKESPEPENDEHLSPEERRQKAIDRALDAALKKPKTKRKRKGEEVSCPPHPS